MAAEEAAADSREGMPGEEAGTKGSEEGTMRGCFVGEGRANDCRGCCVEGEGVRPDAAEGGERRAGEEEGQLLAKGEPGRRRRMMAQEVGRKGKIVGAGFEAGEEGRLRWGPRRPSFAAKVRKDT